MTNDCVNGSNVSGGNVSDLAVNAIAAEGILMRLRDNVQDSGQLQKVNQFLAVLQSPLFRQACAIQDALEGLKETQELVDLDASEFSIDVDTGRLVLSEDIKLATAKATLEMQNATKADANSGERDDSEVTADTK